MPARARPTSPHVLIYRWQIGNTLSILHRITGAALAVGLLALSYWLLAIAGGPQSYADASRLFSSPLGIFFLVCWGFEKTQRHASGWFAVIGALVLTAGTWGWMWSHHS